MYSLLQAALCVCVCTARLNHLLTVCNLSKLGLDESVYVYIVIAFAARFFIITIENKSSERKKCIRFLHTDILILTKTITYKSLKKMFNSQNNYSVA